MHFAPGDWVVYRKTKHSPHPGPRAAQVSPAKAGELYAYVVDKFWVVCEIEPDGRLLLETRRGKQHRVSPQDPCLKRANWWQRLRYGHRFRAVESAIATRVARTGAQSEPDLLSGNDS